MERPKGCADNYDNTGDNARTWLKNVRLAGFCYGSNLERIVSGWRVSFSSNLLWYDVLLSRKEGATLRTLEAWLDNGMRML